MRARAAPAALLLLLPLGSPHEPCACEPMPAPKRVFFNRVPKCGSTTMESFIAAAVKRHGFTFIRSEDFVHQHLPAARRCAFVRYISRKRAPFLYDRHMHYIRFDEFDRPAPIYINLVRDPAAVRVSDFYFHRECVCSLRSEWCRSEWRLRSGSFCNRTINDAYALRAPVPTAGFLTTYFCGHDPECRSAGRGAFFSTQARNARNLSAAVALAKRVVRSRYTWIGVLEEFSGSLRLLSHLLPSYFGGLSTTFWARQKRRPSHTKRGISPSDETMAKLRAELAPDYEVYDYILRLLRCKLRACGFRGMMSDPPPDGRAQALAMDAAERADAERINRDARVESESRLADDAPAGELRGAREGDGEACRSGLGQLSRDAEAALAQQGGFADRRRRTSARRDGGDRRPHSALL